MSILDSQLSAVGSLLRRTNMSSQQSTVDFIVDQLAGAGDLLSRKMFGEYALYCDTKIFALICDDQLFIKPTEAGRKYLKEVVEKPPYPGSKNYFWISGDLWDDADFLRELVKVCVAELPLPKPKKRKA